MTIPIQSLNETEHGFDAAAGRFFLRHPYLGFFAAFIAVPILMLAAVAIGTTAIVVPLAFGFGWL